MNGFCDALPAYFSGDRARGRRGERSLPFPRRTMLSNFLFQFNHKRYLGASSGRIKFDKAFLANNFEICVFVSIIL